MCDTFPARYRDISISLGSFFSIPAVTILMLATVTGVAGAEPTMRPTARVTPVISSHSETTATHRPARQAPVQTAESTIKVTSAQAPGRLQPLVNPAREITIKRLQPGEELAEQEDAEPITSPPPPPHLPRPANGLTPPPAPDSYRPGELYRGMSKDRQYLENLTDEQRQQLFDRRRPDEYGISQSHVPQQQRQPENIAAILFDQEGTEHSAFGYQREWYPSYALWEAPSMFHRPLYFEEVNLERYGHRHTLLQPGLSAAHFVGNAIALPYKIGVNHPCERIYTLGHYRPGDCNPHNAHGLPWSWRGAAYTGAFYTGAVFVLP